MKSITLELSLKPFKKTDSAYIESVCRQIFEDWRPLVSDADVASVMMWTSDGSELLEYNGSLEDGFEWCCYVGGANNLRPTPKAHDPEGKGLHSRRYYYMEPLSDIASRYGRKEANVRMMLSRTRQKLRAYLKQEGYL